MFVQETQRVINAFLDRFVMNNEVDIGGPDVDFHRITAIENKEHVINVYFAIENYAFCVYFDNNDELHIEVDGESVFDYAEEQDWNEQTVNYIKFGKEKEHD